MTKYEIIQTCFIGGVIRNPGDVIETEEKLSKAVATPVGKAAPAKAEKPAGKGDEKSAEDLTS